MANKTVCMLRMDNLEQAGSSSVLVNENDGKRDKKLQINM